jgi:hypothetical protein
MTREARQGIFRASDANGDDVVSEKEYVNNPIIADEAKAQQQHPLNWTIP